MSSAIDPGFRRMDDGRAIDLLDHVRQVVTDHAGVELLVGSDSQNKARHTVYSTAVVMRFPMNGAHVIYRREKARKVTDLWTRLWTEVERSLAIAEYLREKGGFRVHRIDMDLNSDERFGSNRLHSAAVGFIRAHGYEPRTKPDLLIASWAADLLCNGSGRKHEAPIQH